MFPNLQLNLQLNLQNNFTTLLQEIIPSLKNILRIENRTIIKGDMTKNVFWQ